MQWYIFSLLFISCVVARSVNFTSPCDDTTWQVGSRQTITFTTDLRFFVLLLVQHDPTSTATSTQEQIGSIESCRHSESNLWSCIWYVKTYNFDLAVSDKFYIHVGQNDDISAYFTITPASSKRALSSRDDPSSLGGELEDVEKSVDDNLSGYEDAVAEQ